jgi:hypothetical protein
MFTRLARFEGGAYDDITAEALELSSKLEAARRGETSEYFPAELVDRLRRVEMLADRDRGSVAMLLYCDDEADCLEVDRIMDGMSPRTAGWGTRVSRDVYEVIDDRVLEARRAA